MINDYQYVLSCKSILPKNFKNDFLKVFDVLSIFIPVLAFVF